MEALDLSLTCEFTNTAGCIICISPVLQNCCFLAVVHIHNGVLAIKKNTFEPVLMRWMKLEPIIQSEVSQKEKHQYSILTHIYGI